MAASIKMTFFGSQILLKQVYPSSRFNSLSSNTAVISQCQAKTTAAFIKFISKLLAGMLKLEFLSRFNKTTAN